MIQSTYPVKNGGVQWNWDGNWYCGRFIIEGTRGLTFVGSEGHHHFNPTKCEELYEIKE